MPKLIKSLLYFLLTILMYQGLTVGRAFTQNMGKTLNPPQKLKGLNAPVVLSLIKDAKGFMWFFTPYGLVRYDGYNFKTYSNDPDDSTSMPAIMGISTMIEGVDGKIWLGTQQNLLVEFDPVTEVFTSYPMDSTISENYRNWISTMYFDHSGNLWLGCQYEGFYRLNLRDTTFKLYRQQTEKPIHDKDHILSFLEMDENKLLVGTGEGLYVLDRKTDSIQPFTLANPLPEDFDKASFSSLLNDRIGAIWIGSNMGLFRFDPDNGKLTQFVHEPDNPQSLSGNIIQHFYTNPLDDGQKLWIIVWAGSERAVINRIDITTGIVERFVSTHDKPANVYDYYLDESGLLWMATDNQGVFFIDLKDNPFQHFNVNTGKSKEDNYSASAFYTDSHKDLWVGTGQGGLFQYDASGNLKKRYKNLPGSAYSFPTMVYSMLEDSKNNFWVSYWADFLYRRDPETGKFKRYKLKFPVVDLPFYRATEICEDEYGKVWVGSGNGVYFTDINKKQIEPFTWVDFPVFGMSHTRSLCVDKSGTLWVTTDIDGLFCLSPENRDSLQFINYRHNPEVEGSISSNIVFSVYCSDDGTVWIGTGNGLNRFDPETGTFEYFSMKNGFDAYFVYCVRTDGSGIVWASTEKGLVRFNPDAAKGRKFKLFTTNDGLPFDKIYPYHFDKGKDGWFYLGGERGFGLGYFTFHPDSIKDNTLIPSMTITGFEIENKAIGLDTAISYKKQLNLGYDQNYISFEFAVLDYNDPEKNQYAYKLEGVDDDWIYSGNRRFANYTGLSPGTYIFRVKGSNNDGYWNEEGVSIRISIATPPWKTWWAYLIYLVLVSSILILVFRFYMHRQRLLHQLELEHLESDKLKEIDSMKSRFFANISHEFRTPLTLIMGPLQKMIGKAAGNTDKQELTMMQRNVRRLQQLINQLLDLSKLEAGRMQLQCSEMNIVEWGRMHVQSFESLARQRKINFIFEQEQPEIICFFDPEKMARVLNNLLSNAFKFTGKGGVISVKVCSPQSAISSRQSAVTGDLTEDCKDQCVGIKISDTGPGIPAEKLPHIFDRFYQTDGSQTRKHEGTGIGLALVKELVELHHGSITVESIESKGTTFSIVLPLGKEHLKPEEIVISPPEVPEIETIIKSQLPEMVISEETPEEIEKTGKHILLIVEDNADMRNYIRGFFRDTYKILEAENGQKGLDLAVKHVPDIIVSDVMMPVMDGYALCQKIKSDQRTNHIPLVLLTARSSGADKIEGLETGADDFVIKPFEGKELQVRVKNLIVQRAKLREHFQKEFILDVPLQASSLPSMDQQYLRKAMKILELHLSDPEFGVEELAGQMAMSRVQLHRKIKAITDLSPGDFIRSLRLKKAAGMLRSGSGNITQIAFSVGFNNPSWFAECFKKQFGALPSEYGTD